MTEASGEGGGAAEAGEVVAVAKLLDVAPDLVRSIKLVGRPPIGGTIVSKTLGEVEGASGPKDRSDAMVNRFAASYERNGSEVVIVSHESGAVFYFVVSSLGIGVASNATWFTLQALCRKLLRSDPSGTPPESVPAVKIVDRSYRVDGSVRNEHVIEFNDPEVAIKYLSKDTIDVHAEGGDQRRPTH